MHYYVLHIIDRDIQISWSKEHPRSFSNLQFFKIKEHSEIDRWLLRHKDIRVSGEFKELHFQGCGITSRSLFTDSPCLSSLLEQK